jgi:hypothetical protein
VDTKSPSPTATRNKPEAAFDEVVALRRYNDALKSTRTARKEFWMNDAFMRGYQWVHYNPVTCHVDEVPRDEDDDRVQATVNRMWPLARTLAAKMGQRELVFDVTPTKADDATIRGARTAEAIVRDVHDKHDWESLRDNLNWSILKGGTAAICVDWDSDLGDEIPQYEDDESDDDEDETDNPRMINGTPLFTGDTVETALSIAEFVIQPGAKVAEKALWFYKACAFAPEEVQAQYDLENLPSADSMAGLSPLQQRLVSYDDSSPNLTLVLTYYERPNKMCRKGRVATIINGRIVGEIKPWPFPWEDRLNIVVFRETPLSSHWWGETVLSMARPLQVAFNTVWSAIIEHVKKTGNAKLAVSQSNIDLMEEMTDEIGEIIPYTDGTEKPSWIDPAQLPAYIQNVPNQLSEQIDDVFGVHEISRGGAPGRVDSANGLSILSENDSTPIGRIIADQARGWGKVASMVLKLYEKNVTESREAIVRSPGLPAMTVEWTGKDLLGQTDATVPAGQIMPRTRAEQVAVADKMMQMGIITTVAQWVHVAEAPNEKEFLALVAPDVERARRENHDMRTGKVRFPAKFDNHAVHIEEHNTFRKSLEYELLDEETRKIIDDHVDAHETLAAEEMAKQVNRAQTAAPMAAVPTADGSPTLPPEVLGGAAPAGQPTDQTAVGMPPNTPMEGTPPDGAMAAAPPAGPSPVG